MQVTFLFWNLMKKPLAHRVAQIAAHYAVDVVILAECETPLDEVTAALNQKGTGQWVVPFSRSPKLHLLTRLSAVTISDQYNDPNGRISIRRMESEDAPALLIALVHFPSKINNDFYDQTLLASRMAQHLAEVEKDAQLTRTVVVGDMNMNPYEPGMMAAQAFHAVMTQADASREQRVVDGEPYRFFYNPMWGHFGDRTEGPPGTYFLDTAKSFNAFWNMYDQVLVRPELMNNLREVRIIDTDGIKSLVSKSGRPNSTTASDHLPLLVRLEL